MDGEAGGRSATLSLSVALILGSKFFNNAALTLVLILGRYHWDMGVELSAQSVPSVVGSWQRQAPRLNTLEFSQA